MRAIYVDRSHDESVCIEVVAVFTDPQDPRIRQFFDQIMRIRDGSEDETWYISDYHPPLTDPKAFEELGIKDNLPTPEDLLKESEKWVEEKKREGWTQEDFANGFAEMLGVVPANQDREVF